ncbi:MAG: CPBP family intramembrane glutamic endopeptidase [Limisphaerales bacterium]
MEQNPTRSSRHRLDVGIIIALLVALVVRPLLYTLITPMNLSGMADGSTPRSHWWLFYAWILFWEWMPFGVLCWALRRNGRLWSEIGIDWSFFVRYRIAFLAALAVFTVAAVVAPRFLYHGDVPRVSQTYSFLPVTGLERVFFLIAAVSAGICEEICYRGLPLGMFAGSTTKACLVLPVAMVAFVFIHGRFGASRALYYLIFGLLYGGVFILLCRRRLEWLITAHVLYDSLLIFAP